MKGGRRGYQEGRVRGALGREGEGEYKEGRGRGVSGRQGEGRVSGRDGGKRGGCQGGEDGREEMERLVGLVPSLMGRRGSVSQVRNLKSVVNL